MSSSLWESLTSGPFPRQMRTVRARREVILSAGAIGSPHLLMLSGVGPAEHLQQHGVRRTPVPSSLTLWDKKREHNNITEISVGDEYSRWICLLPSCTQSSRRAASPVCIVIRISSSQIPVLVDLPGVGHNMQDHPSIFGLAWTTRKGVSTSIPRLADPKTIKDYIFNRQGVCGGGGRDYFLRLFDMVIFVGLVLDDYRRK